MLELFTGQWDLQWKYNKKLHRFTFNSKIPHTTTTMNDINMNSMLLLVFFYKAVISTIFPTRELFI